MITAEAGETYVAGGVAEAGSYKCRGCGLRIGIDHIEEVPRCPACGDTRFRRAPLFDAARAIGSPPATLEESVLGAEPEEPPWLAQTRALLAVGERYVVFEHGAAIRVVPIPVGWSRVGRAVTSDIRLDDPTVSRRHALLVRAADDEIRLLDDRSLNGVRVNGKAVEWGTLADGDELGIGRFRLYLVALEPAGSRSSEPALASD
jgi:DNA-directed RNA polymerase subunit RPC12/RpoP